MTIQTNTFIPYEFSTKREAFQYITDRAHGIKHSLRIVEKNTGHLIVRCPMSGEYIEVYGTEEEINWVVEQLSCAGWSRAT